ncbi:Galactokinase [Limihaloglobus sulfuriphilus]|uniref:Galactokinase n=1 Tax=Limihaloglobus sulfuriphilus TaxID=1851148 RepID=A0A1Q2MEK1_9BACT|nr:sugar phosphate nucleotidyltransferase [Limihaloglobus sulfuriphilus]AQQ70672.1 Galactokinase [Limihaloglobus sulfuriphilus]
MHINRSVAAETVVVILAAGQGTRMGRSDLAKVCFEIDGIPAINRTIATFKKHGFAGFLLVVGSRAEQVMETVSSKHPEVGYIFQSPQLGTGHAAKIASETLQNMRYSGNIIITMGDKFLDDGAVDSLLEGFIKQQAHASIFAIPKTKQTQGSGGRIFIDESGQAADIIEKPDLQKQAVVDEIRSILKTKDKLKSSLITKIAEKHISSPKKRASAVGELIEICKQHSGEIDKKQLMELLDCDKYNITVNGSRYTSSQIEKKCKFVNASLYMFKAEAFYQGVSLINNDNAQKEYYLTDIVKSINGIKDSAGKSKYSVKTISARNPDLIQGFNSPDELLRIQDYVRRIKDSAKTAVYDMSPQLPGNKYCTVDKWIEKIKNEKPSVKRWLKDTYGDHAPLHKRKCSTLLKTLSCYGKRFGFDQKVCIVRAPGRANIMGRHVDHRGGFNNYLAIDRETIMVAGPRDDSNVEAVNVEPVFFKNVKFNVNDIIGRFAWSDWINFVDSEWVRSMLLSKAGDWGNYIRASMVRLQHKFNDIKVNGMNLAVYGDVPIAAGLSSSSSIVVATLQAAIALNNFELTSSQFIDMCGEGEWFVGSRGGSGDHAAIRMGKRGKIAHVGHFPFRVEEIVDAPEDYQVMIANSYIKAAKSHGAKDMFNAKITSYNLGFELLRQRCPEFLHIAEYLRDIEPVKLGCKTSDIYRMFLKIPQQATRAELREMLSSDCREMIEKNFSSHKDPGTYHLRGVLLFGIAEIARSRLTLELLKCKDTTQIGRIMKISHDGDRVSRDDGTGKYIKVDDGCTDAYFNQLINDLHSEDPEKVTNAQLYMQPGYYACSTPEIDRMVDIAGSVAGVAGAQLAGAGLGGCIMILAKKKAAATVKKALTKDYYEPKGLKPAVLDCITVEGAGLVSL